MEVFHLLNRGVDKRQVFMEESDYVRFIRDIFVFNDTHQPPTNVATRDHTTKVRHVREPLVHIHAYCLMPNHYHILVSEAVENGISLFMKKLNMGYARHFNEKYGRSGALWQGKYKKVRIERDAHFLYIPYYIHLNPLDLTHPEWREGKVKKIKAALEALSAYRWSSHLDYMGVKNFPSLLDMSLLSSTLGPPTTYRSELTNILEQNIRDVDSMSIEFESK